MSFIKSIQSSGDFNFDDFLVNEGFTKDDKDNSFYYIVEKSTGSIIIRISNGIIEMKTYYIDGKSHTSLIGLVREEDHLGQYSSFLGYFRERLKSISN
jgi:hypothetical protein